MNNNNYNNKKRIQIIILIIIILLLVSSCTAFSFFGKIGMYTIERAIQIETNTNDKEIIKNQNLKFDIDENKYTQEYYKINMVDGDYKISFTSKGITSKNYSCQTADANIATCIVEDGYVRIKPISTGKIELSLSVEDNNKKYIAQLNIEIINKKDNKSEVSKKTNTKKTSSNNSQAKETTHKETKTSAYLKSLEIEGFDLNPKFNSKTYDYVVEVEYDTTKINIKAVAKNGTITSKIGTIELTGDTTIYQIVVESSSGDKTIYTIKINKKEKYHIVQEEEKTFKVDADYSLFVTGGKLYVDNNFVDPSNYTHHSGSIIIEFTLDYYNTLTQGYHSIKVVLNNNEIVETIFEKLTPYIPPTIKSHDATLKYLAVEGYEISPEFDKNKLNYYVTVPNSMTSIIVDAQTTNSRANATVYNYDNLVVGTNTVTIHVTAEDGTTRDYIITVTRQDVPSPASYYVTTNTNYDAFYQTNQNNYKNIIIESNILETTPSISTDGNKYILSDGTNQIILESTNMTFEYIRDTSTSSYTIKVSYTSSGTKTFNIKGIRENITISNYDVTFNIIDRYIVKINANGGFFSETSDLYELTMYKDDILDLTDYNTAYKESETACMYFTLESYNTNSLGNGTPYGLTSTITITSDLELFAIYSTTDTTTDIETEKTLYLSDVELFVNEDNVKEAIKPSSKGAYIMNIKNTTGKKITLKELTLSEDSICVDFASYCLNMGYVIKEQVNSKYYFGSSNDYAILNSYTNSSDRVHNPNDTYTSSKVISLEDRELQPDEEMELSLLWKWVDDNENDYKIGNYVISNNDMYYLTVSFKFVINDKGC